MRPLNKAVFGMRLGSTEARQISRRLRRRLKDTVYGGACCGFRALSENLSDAGVVRVGRQMGRVAYRLSGSSVRRAREQLRSAFPEKPSDEIEDLTRQCFENAGLTLVEILRFSRLHPKNIGDYVEIVGTEHIETALRAGHGYIGLTAHYGNWELLAAALVLNGYEIAALARELRSETLNAVLAEQREKVGVRALSRETELREAVKTLTSNRGLGILSDVDTAVESVWVDFFGKPARTPVGPVVLSRRFEAPALPMFLVRKEGLCHRLEIYPPIAWAATGDETADLQENTARYTRIIEAQIRRAPEQWIWFHPRWKQKDGR